MRKRLQKLGRRAFIAASARMSAAAGYASTVAWTVLAACGPEDGEPTETTGSMSGPMSAGTGYGYDSTGTGYGYDTGDGYGYGYGY